MVGTSTSGYDGWVPRLVHYEPLMNDDGDKIPVRFLSLPLLCADSFVQFQLIMHCVTPILCTCTL
jgi:hypothetical protein